MSKIWFTKKIDEECNEILEEVSDSYPKKPSYNDIIKRALKFARSKGEI